ncbi:MAG: glycosyltransferase [Candidatus Chisholmbacteria bacterium]|nr:glycosyltransferase [Candidatus Chisholmbacteria bacterium]
MILDPQKPIIITGGHHNSALVIARALKQAGYSIHWLGHRHTMIGDPHDSLEYLEVQNAQIPFHSVFAGKFHPQANPWHLLRLPLGFIHALWLLIRLRPQLILAFGGYLAVPVGIVGWILRIPLILFEQTTTVGRGTKLLSRLSRYNFLAWESSLPFFPQKNTQVVGLPIPDELTAKTHPKKFSLPTILITGGKQGAHVLNQATFPIIRNLVANYIVIHQTGLSLRSFDIHQAQIIKSSLPQSLRSHYQPHAFLETSDMISYLKQSDLVLSRAGAHICAELLALGKPCILIPLPFSYNAEQQKNAAVLKRVGLATILDQSQLNSQNLAKTIASVFKNYSKFAAHKKAAQKLIRRGAKAAIIQYLLN